MSIIPPLEESAMYRVEGTPEQIASYAAKLDSNLRVTLLVPHAAPAEPTPAGSSPDEKEPNPYAGQKWDELVAPLHEDFRASGMTSEEVCELIDRELATVRAEIRARNAAT